MKILKNSSGKVLLSGGKPIKAQEPETVTLGLYDESGVYYWKYLDLVNNAIQTFRSPY